MAMLIRLASVCLVLAVASACEDGPNTNSSAARSRPDDARPGSGKVGGSAMQSSGDADEAPPREPQLTDSVAGSGAAGSGFDAGLPSSAFGGAGAGSLPGGLGGSGAVGGSGPFAGFGG